MKYIRISVSAYVLIVAFAMSNAFVTSGSMDLFSIIIITIIIVILVGPALLVGLGVSMAVGAVIAGIAGRKRRKANVQELKEIGCEKLIDLDKQRAQTQVANFFLKILKWLLRLVFVVIVIISGVTISGEGVDGGGVIAVLVLILIGVIAISIVVQRKSNQFNAGFKELVVKTSLESAFSNVVFKPHESINEFTAKTSGLLGEYSIFSGNDYLSAEYMGRSFVLSDLHLEDMYDVDVTDDDGNSRTETRRRDVFYGRLMMLDCNAVACDPVYVYDKRVFKGRKTTSSSRRLYQARRITYRLPGECSI